MAHKHYDAVPGRIVQSRAGRDTGKFFVIVKIIDADYVLIADGRTHKLNKPKKKKYKHLVPLPDVLETIAEKLKTDAKVFDSEVSSAIRQFTEQADKI